MTHRRPTATNGSDGDGEGAGSNASSADGEGENEEDAEGTDTDASETKIVSRKKADLGGRPVLLELRGHGYWGEEAERMPVRPVSRLPSLPSEGVQPR